MKHLMFALGISVILPLGSTSLGAQQVKKPSKAIKPRISHAELAAKKRFDPNRAESNKKIPRKDLDRKRVPSNRSRTGIVERSTIISGAGGWTIVPKASVLHVPAGYQKRINGARKGKLLSWKDFHAKNRSWIRLYPVSITQATGETPLTEEAIASLKRTGVLAVATCKGGPISVKLTTEPKKGEEKANSSPPAKTRDPGVKAPG